MLFAQVLDFLSGIVFLLLHVTGSGTFPKALSKAEEQQCLAEMAQGRVRMTWTMWGRGQNLVKGS